MRLWVMGTFWWLFLHFALSLWLGAQTTALRCPDTTPSPSPWSPRKSDLSGDLEVISAQKEAEAGR